MTVEELLNKITAKELQEWRVYDLISPIGSKRIDMTAAHVLHTVYSFLVGEKNTLYTQEFVLDYEAPFLTEEEIEKRKEALFDHKQQAKLEKTMKGLTTTVDTFRGMQKK